MTDVVLPGRRKMAPAPGLMPRALSDADHAAAIACLKAMAEPTRLRLLDLLAQQAAPVCVCDITPHFDCGQPTVSHHLRLLREAGLIDTVHRGVWSYVWVTEAGRHALALAMRVVAAAAQPGPGAAVPDMALPRSGPCADPLAVPCPTAKEHPLQ